MGEALDEVFLKDMNIRTKPLLKGPLDE